MLRKTKYKLKAKDAYTKQDLPVEDESKERELYIKKLTFEDQLNW